MIKQKDEIMSPVLSELVDSRYWIKTARAQEQDTEPMISYTNYKVYIYLFFTI